MRAAQNIYGHHKTMRVSEPTERYLPKADNTTRDGSGLWQLYSSRIISWHFLGYSICRSWREDYAWLKETLWNHFHDSRGILCLHEDPRLRIIKRNLKVGNVLLDASMNLKISDFGLARIYQKSCRDIVSIFNKFIRKKNQFAPTTHLSVVWKHSGIS